MYVLYHIIHHAAYEHFLLYQVASATASPKYVIPLLFFKKNSSF